MSIRWIKRLSWACTISLTLGLATIFGGIAVSVLTGSELIFTTAFVAGWSIIIAGIPLWIVAEFVRCPQCGRPFHRREYRHWISWFFTRISPRWSCLHCGFDGSE
jgi:hypothetical protein